MRVLVAVWEGSVLQNLPPQGMVFSVTQGRAAAWGWEGWVRVAECSQKSILLCLIHCFLASSASGWVLESPTLGVGAQACMGKGSAQPKSCGQPSHVVYLKKKQTMILCYFCPQSTFAVPPNLLCCCLQKHWGGGGFQAHSCVSDPED